MKSKIAILALGIALAGCSGSDSHPNRDPNIPENRSLRGYNYHADSMQAGDMEFHWIQQAVEGYRRASRDDLPAKVEFLPNSGCGFPRKEKEQVSHVVHIANGPRPTSVYYVPRKYLAERAKDYTNAYVRRKGDIPQTVTFTVGKQMSAVNVVVTETRPTMLVLISQSDTIWNFQIAENANLQQVVLLGRQEAGVANLPDGIKLHSVTGAQASKCGLNVWRYPKTHWKSIAEIKDSKDPSHKELLNRERTNGRKFQGWISNNYRVSAKKVLGDNVLGNFLIGPMPGDKKLPFQSIAGSTVKVSRAPNLMVAKPAEFRAASQELVKKAAQKAAGGDMTKLLASAN